MDEERIINNRKLKLTNLTKVYWPDEKITKGDLIDYYTKVSKYILPYLKDRPESLNRYPNGIKGPSFYQKDVKGKIASWIKTVKVFSESNNEYINYLVCQDEATLVYLANLGCIEINPWFSTIEHLNNPDYFAIDLDPDGNSFEEVMDVAKAVKEVLDKAGAPAFCKTSGATGMHIYVPLKAKYDFDIAKEFAHVVAQITSNMLPSITSLVRNPSKRKGKIYVDFLQNRRGQTLAAPYSVRPKPNATVSTPLKWTELKKGLTPQDFTMKNIFKRLDKTGDLFKGIFAKGVNIEKCLKKLN